MACCLVPTDTIFLILPFQHKHTHASYGLTFRWAPAGPMPAYYQPPHHAMQQQPQQQHAPAPGAATQQQVFYSAAPPGQQPPPEVHIYIRAAAGWLPGWLSIVDVPQ